MSPRRRTTNERAKARHRLRWTRLDDQALLELRFCDLDLDISKTLVAPDVDRLYRELERRAIDFRPHVWLSEDWFSPDGVPGIAVPFYVAHERLRDLERTIMGDVDGGSRNSRARILRHEAGHAVDTAFRLRRRSDWRRVFGRASLPYPREYWSKPNSRRHVLHLAHWYAQSHPTEDFAETFAVWLRPRSHWRRDYAGWPALAKLEFVDRLMAELAHAGPWVRNRWVIEPLSANTRTLKEHYRRKRARYSYVDRRYDRWLLRTFTAEGGPRAASAGRFLRERAPRFRRALVRERDFHPYLVDHVIDHVTVRARRLKLKLRGTRAENDLRVVRLLERVALDVMRRNREHWVV